MGVCIFEVWTWDLELKNQNSKLSHKTFDKNGEDGGGAVFSRFNGVCTRN
jgi:hypothetical protein